MIFDDHCARWSFSSASAFDAYQLRNQFVSVLYACGTPASDFFSAELIYVELVANSVRHAPGRISVDLDWSRRHPVLSVADGQPGFLWSGELPRNPFDERGRGLYIVRELALALELKTSGPHAKVSAMLPVERKRDLADLFEYA